MSKRPLVFAFALGAVHSLSFAPDPLPAAFLPWLQVICLVIFFFLIANAPRAARAASIGFFFGMGTFVTGLYWLTVSMHQYGGMPLWMAIIALIGFAAYLSLYPTLSAWLFRRMSAGQTQDLTPKGIIGLGAFWAAIWTLCEWLRGTLLTGFAWLNTASGQVEGWLAGWSAWIGPYGITFIVAWVSAIVACSLHNNRLRQAHGFRGVQTLPLFLAGLLCAAGAFLAQWSWTHDQGPAVVIRLVQGDIDQAEKFTPQGFLKAIELYQSLSGHEQDQQQHKPDIVLLPETVMTQVPNRIHADIWSSWIQTATDHNTSILMGSPLQQSDAGGYTNSVILIDRSDQADSLQQSQVRAHYDKQHLVPFGEYVPWGFQWFIDLMHIPLGHFETGSSEQRPLQVANQSIAPNICYEDVFAEDLLPSVRQGATILANFSNLGWFGNTNALTQHWQMARLRAMETQRPMVRSTNTGMTGAIDHWGNTIAVLPTMAAGYVDVRIQGQTGLTPYVRYGNTPVLIVCLLIVIIGVPFSRRLQRPTLKQEAQTHAD
ncbi:apolipoprotein N-acyltransferase [Orrella sp. 11846]|uniref:apolipoprotein N-acyltransferase n=1 Tax=Orrella sp. 11846 TaxID=3409913 RepID=UPI003B5A92B1